MKTGGKIIKSIEQRLAKYIPVRLLENPHVLAEKYKTLYGFGDYERQIHMCCQQTARKYIIVMIVSLLLLAGAAAGRLTERGSIPTLERPAYGQATRTLPVEALITAGQIQTKIQTMLKLTPAILTEEEKQRYLEDYADKLPELMKGSNTSLSHVTGDLVLPDLDKAPGIHITWETEQPEVIGQDGLVDNISWPQKEEREVELTARLVMDNVVIRRSYKATVLPNDEPQHVKKVLERKVKQAAELAGKGRGGGTVMLPDTIGAGTKLEWRKVQEDYVIEIIVIGLVVCAGIYQTRYAGIEKQIRIKQEAIIKEFPEFADKLLLLLNAGMVVSAALSKIPADYERCKGSGPPKVLYEELLLISRKVESTNASYINELSKLAERLGIKELLRLTAIITENINKGSTLAEKLETEGEMLWQSRKKRAEEAGRLADTRLVLPLFLLLTALVLISAAPAFMAM